MNKKELKIAIIGCGKIGHGRAEYLQSIDGVKIAAMVDVSQERQEELRPKFPGASFYHNYKEMFNNESVDAVCINTPHEVHYEQTMAALENNCHVLLEKPMAIKEEHCFEMVNLAKQKNLILQIGFECRNSSFYIRIKEIIDSGEIGDLLSMSFIHYRANWVKDWYCKREIAGNSISIIETCHYVDLMRYWSGKDVEWAFSSIPKANFRTEYEYPDTEFSLLGFEGGMIANISDSHARSADRFLNTGTDTSVSYGTLEGEYMDPVYGHQFEYSIVGTKGALWLRMFDKQISVLHREPSINGKRPQVVLKRVEDYNKHTLYSLVHDGPSLDKQFIEHLRNGSSLGVLPEDALKSHLAVLAIEKSGQTGEKVFVTKLDEYK